MDYSNRLLGLALAVAIGAMFCQSVRADENSYIASASLLEGLSDPWSPDLVSTKYDDVSTKQDDVSTKHQGVSTKPDEVSTKSDGPPCLPSVCDECCTGRRWFVEAETVFFSPVLHQKFGTVQFADCLDGKAYAQCDARNNSDFTASPRIAVGVQGECWGIMGRYWQFETGELEPNTSMISGNGITFPNCLQAKTADLEITRLLCLGDNTELRASFGVRYAELNEVGGVFLEETNCSGYYQGAVLSRHKFSGPGVTAGLMGICPVGCNNFNLFLSGRVSVLWDKSAINSVATRAGYFGEVGDAYSANDAIGGSCTSDLFIGEIQVGGQWNVPLKCVPANAFLRVAFEYQYWCIGADSCASAFSAAGPLTGPCVVACGESRGNSHVDLVGFNIGAGFTW
jgi:hypothetical protein